MKKAIYKQINLSGTSQELKDAKKMLRDLLFGDNMRAIFLDELQHHVNSREMSVVSKRFKIADTESVIKQVDFEGGDLLIYGSYVGTEATITERQTSKI